MAKTLQLTILALGAAGLLGLSGARFFTDGSLEVMSIITVCLAIFVARKIRRQSRPNEFRNEFGTVIVMIVFCGWTGGAPFEGMDELWKLGVLIAVYLVARLILDLTERFQ